MKISKVKLAEAGNKGLEISYMKTEMKNGIDYKNDVVEKRKGVVNKEMRGKFKELAPFMAELCHVDESYVTINGVYGGVDQFMLIGVIEVMDTKVSSLCTPLIRLNDDYDDFYKVTKIIDELYTMTAEYMKGDHIENNKNIIINLEGHKEGFDAKALDCLTEKQLHDRAVKLLEKAGCIVIDPSEVEAPEGPAVAMDSEDEQEELFKQKGVLVVEVEASTGRPLDVEELEEGEVIELSDDDIESRLAKMREMADDDFIPLSQEG